MAEWRVQRTRRSKFNFPWPCTLSIIGRYRFICVEKKEISPVFAPTTMIFLWSPERARENINTAVVLSTDVVNFILVITRKKIDKYKSQTKNQKKYLLSNCRIENSARNRCRI